MKQTTHSVHQVNRKKLGSTRYITHRGNPVSAGSRKSGTSARGGGGGGGGGGGWAEGKKRNKSLAAQSVVGLRSRRTCLLVSLRRSRTPPHLSPQVTGFRRTGFLGLVEKSKQPGEPPLSTTWSPRPRRSSFVDRSLALRRQ